MAQSGSGREVEIKLFVESAPHGRKLLKSARFRVIRPRVLEVNSVFDRAEGTLRKRGNLLRLRKAGSRHVLTFKGKSLVGRHKSREELEIHVNDSGVLQTILERVGFKVTFRYEKYRTEFGRHGEKGVATLDETPIGDFIELEGPARWIDRTARELGFSASDYITASYATLYLNHCKQRKRKPRHMVFGG